MKQRLMVWTSTSLFISLLFLLDNMSIIQTLSHGYGN